VKKGDPIVEIDPRDYDAQLKQKQAALESTKAQAAAAQAGVEQQIARVKVCRRRSIKTRQISVPLRLRQIKPRTICAGSRTFMITTLSPSRI